jgi:hypothetical protein
MLIELGGISTLVKEKADYNHKKALVSLGKRTAA